MPSRGDGAVSWHQHEARWEPLKKGKKEQQKSKKQQTRMKGDSENQDRGKVSWGGEVEQKKKEGQSWMLVNREYRSNIRAREPNIDCKASGLTLPLLT